MNRSVFVGTRVGRVAQRLREQWQLSSAAIREPESLETIANDAIARRLLERLCPEGGLFVDIGAHIGSVVDGVRRASKPAAIVAVEAIPEKVRKLRAKFPDVVVHSCALGEEDGETSFFVDDKRSGYSSLFSEGRSSNLRELKVPLRKLDSVLATERVDVMKIDVEGAELGLLKGGHDVIRRGQPIIMFESGPAEEGGYTKRAIWQWFDDEGYEIVVPNRLAHLGDGLSLEGFKESHLYPRRTTNYFAVPRQQRELARARARKVLQFSS